MEILLRRPRRGGGGVSERGRERNRFNNFMKFPLKCIVYFIYVRYLSVANWKLNFLHQYYKKNNLIFYNKKNSRFMMNYFMWNGSRYNTEFLKLSRIMHNRKKIEF